MRMKSHRVVVALLLLLLPLPMICPVLGHETTVLDITDDAQPEGNESRELLASERKHKHHLLFFMGGLKSLAAVVLIKIKIVLVVAAIVAVVIFTIKYLLGSAGLFYKPGFAIPPPQQLHPEPYHTVVHEPVYGYGYPTPIPWDQPSHESYGNDWSKYGEGGRRLIDITNFYPSLEKVLLQNTFNYRRKRIKRKSYLNFNDMYIYN